MKAILTASAVASLASAGVASAQPIRGHWEAGLGTNGMGLGLIVPEYSPNEFVILTLECDPKGRTVTVTHDTALETRPKSLVVPLLVDGKAFSLRGKPWLFEASGSWYLDGKAPYGSPVVAALSQARTLGVGGDPQTRSLPTAGFATARAKWLRRCGIR